MTCQASNMMHVKSTKMENIMTPNQIQAGRVGLNLTRAELAKAAGVSEATILRMEKPKAKASSLSRNRDKVVSELERLGVVLNEDGSVTIPTSGDA